jgi:hypothetical protein
VAQNSPYLCLRREKSTNRSAAGLDKKCLRIPVCLLNSRSVAILTIFLNEILLVSMHAMAQRFNSEERIHVWRMLGMVLMVAVFTYCSSRKQHRRPILTRGDAAIPWAASRTSVRHPWQPNKPSRFLTVATNASEAIPTPGRPARQAQPGWSVA